MKVRLRGSVFETNSSSSHSVTVAQEEITDLKISKKYLRGGVIRVNLRNFGWEWRRFYSPGSKIAYLIAQMAPGEGEIEGKDVTSIVRRNGRVCSLLDIVEEVSGCRVEVIGATESCVDNNSVGTGVELVKSRDQLIKFIFGNGSFFETGNDNSSPPSSINTDQGDDESYHEHRFAPALEGGVRFELTIDLYKNNVFMHPEDGEPIYAHIGDHEDMECFISDLDGMVIERFAVWSQRPIGLTEEDATDEVREFVHEYLDDLSNTLPHVKVIRDFVIDCSFDVTSRALDTWERKGSAHFTISAAADHDKVSRMSALLIRHSGVAANTP